MRTELLKELLAVPTCTNEENAVVEFLVRHAAERGYRCAVDAANNVFMSKGELKEGEYFPLVCAHTDSVHKRIPVVIKEVQGEVWAVDRETGARVGCGGDDKCGVFICLELLERQERLKAAFFVGEECFCIGSRAAGPEFFSDVGYCMEFDSPQGDIISFSSNGLQLFDPEGDFAKVAIPVMDAYGANKWQDHPYTDIAILKHRFDFTCVNLPAGYYNMHSRNEYVKLDEVQNAVNLGGSMLDALGFTKYPWGPARRSYNEQWHGREVTGLILE